MSELLNFLLTSGEDFRQARLPSLYSDFQLQRSSNPDGFAANYTAWKNALSQAAQHELLPSSGAGKDTLAITTGESLLQALGTREWGRPLALGSVIEEGLSQRHLIPLSEFLSARNNINTQSWTSRSWWLLSWGLKQLGIFNTASTGRLPADRFVILGNVEDAATKVLTQMSKKPNRIDRTFPMGAFRREASEVLRLSGAMSDTDLDVLLKYLSRDKRMAYYNETTVVLKGGEAEPRKLTDQDVTIASLKSSISDLQAQVDQLSTLIASASEKAKTAVSAGHRSVAMTAVRSRKIYEKRLEQRGSTLSQLEEVYGKIEQAADQASMIRIMQASTNVLRNVNREVGGVEKAQEIAEQLHGEVSNVDEVGDIIRSTDQGIAPVDEDAVDEELEEMLREEEAREEKRRLDEEQMKLDSAPKVPDVRLSDTSETTPTQREEAPLSRVQQAVP